MPDPIINIGPTPQDETRQRLAQAMMGQGVSAAPVGHWTQALARIAQAYAGKSMGEDVAEGIEGRRTGARETLADALSAYRGDVEAPVMTETAGPVQPGAMPPMMTTGEMQTIPGQGADRAALMQVLATNPDLADVAQQTELSRIMSAGGDFKVPSGYMKAAGGGVQQIPGFVNTGRYKPFTYTDEGGNLVNALVDVGQLQPGAGMTQVAGQPGPPGGPGAPTIGPGGVVQLGTKKERAMTMEAGSKAAMMQQGMQDVKAAQPLLFPGGKFDRMTALSAQFNVPGTEGRLVGSYYFNALNAKLRAESGAAVPEEEVKRAMRTFMPNALDNDNTAKEKQRRLHQFMSTALTNVDPTGRLIPADAELNKWMSESEQKTAAYEALPKPQSQADWGALPKGTRYIDPDDGKEYIK